MKNNLINAAETSLKKNGRTFHWARRFLGDPMGQNAAQLYQFCRILDDLADGDLPNGPERLLQFDHALKKGNIPEDGELAAFWPFIEENNLPLPVIKSLVDGLIMDQSEVALKTEKDIIRYSYHVAGTVGLLMCFILDCADEEAYPYAIDLGIAMQLTNIARDVLEDAEMGRRYLPASWVKNMSPEDITQAAAENDTDQIHIVRTAVQRTLSLAEQYYDSGINGLSFLPSRAHIAILIAARSYRQIGIQLARRGSNWHQGRQVTSGFTKARTSLFALPMMAKRLIKTPPHQDQLHDALDGLPHARSS